MRSEYKEISVPEFLKGNPYSRNVKAYRRKNMCALVSEDNTPKWGWLKHISISCPDRHPSWEEILGAKEHFFGDIDCMMIMPKQEDYVNVHQHTFHIWQTPEGWGLK